MKPTARSSPEQMIGNLLRAAVSSAAAIVALGALIYLFRHGSEHPSYAAFLEEPRDLSNLPGILRGVLACRGRAIIQMGIVLLIATPVVRVALSILAFARERDWFYANVALLVLLVLLLSLAGIPL